MSQDRKIGLIFVAVFGIFLLIPLINALQTRF